MARLISSASDIGVVRSFAGTTIPDGWLACNGASLSTTTYADLFAVIGYTYGGSGGVLVSQTYKVDLQWETVLVLD